MTHLNIISQNPESTLVSEFKRDDKRERSYQSEAALEAAFIRQLQEQGYEYLPIVDEKSLIANLRSQLERLNDFKFSDSEWDLFFRMVLGNVTFTRYCSNTTRNAHVKKSGEPKARDSN